MLNIFTSLESWITTTLENLGEPGVGLLVLLENLFPPIPSELILPLGGFTASQGEFSLMGVIFWATIGSTTGAISLYYVGAFLGRDRTRALFEKMPFVSVEDVDKTENWFLKHETKTVFFGRMVPVFRSLISIPAGVERMNLVVFVAYTAAGSLVWNSALVSLGFFLGENYRVVEQYVGIFQYFVLALVVAGLAYFVIKRVRGSGEKSR